jgi:hypothetical protein
MLDVKDRVRADAPVKTYIHYWIVPARVAGTWRWKLPAGGRTVDYELELSQSYQMVSGTLRAGGKEVTLQEASLEGERIALAFTADIEGRAMRHTLAGRVIGNSIVGTAAITGGRAKERLDWKAGLQSKP